MKKCIKCLEVKDENKFYLRKDTGNRRGICKSCKNKLHKSKLRGDKDLREKELKTTKNWQRENQSQVKKNKANWRKNNPWTRSLEGAKARCINKNKKCYKNYGGRGIKCLITKEEVKRLWTRDGAEKMVKPSIDRKNNNGNYTFGNCRFIEHVENIRKGNR